VDDGNGIAPAIRYFATEGAELFSAVTVYSGRFRIIVHNDRHAPTRQASNVVHELSHTLLEHPAHPDLTPKGCRHVDARIEDEADWLMGALLVPRDGALRPAWEGASVDQVAQHFGVSGKLCQWRLASTGVLTQLARGQRS